MEACERCDRQRPAGDTSTRCMCGFKYSEAMSLPEPTRIVLPDPPDYVKQRDDEIARGVQAVAGVSRETHYLPYFTNDGPKGTQEAACTAYIDPACHSDEPSCSGCRAWLDNDADALKKLRDVERGAY